MIATNMEELSGLSEYICDGSHTHGQSRGTALKLAAGMPVEAAGELARREVLASHLCAASLCRLYKFTFFSVSSTDTTNCAGATSVVKIPSDE